MSWPSMRGPTDTPASVRAAIMIAMLELPGMPKNRVGIIAPPSFALLAASGAITPAMAPWPNGISDFAVRAA